MSGLLSGLKDLWIAYLSLFGWHQDRNESPSTILSYELDLHESKNGILSNVTNQSRSFRDHSYNDLSAISPIPEIPNLSKSLNVSRWV